MLCLCNGTPGYHLYEYFVKIIDSPGSFSNIKRPSSRKTGYCLKGAVFSYCKDIEGVMRAWQRPGRLDIFMDSLLIFYREALDGATLTNPFGFIIITQILPDRAFPNRCRCRSQRAARPAIGGQRPRQGPPAPLRDNASAAAAPAKPPPRASRSPRAPADNATSPRQREARLRPGRTNQTVRETHAVRPVLFVVSNHRLCAGRPGPSRGIL